MRGWLKMEGGVCHLCLWLFQNSACWGIGKAKKAENKYPSLKLCKMHSLSSQTWRCLFTNTNAQAVAKLPKWCRNFLMHLWLSAPPAEASSENLSRSVPFILKEPGGMW